MGKIIFILLISQYSFQISFSQSGWVMQNSGTTLNINEVQFTDEFNGFAAAGYIYSTGQGNILKTSTGGSSWFSIYNSANTPMLTIFFVNTNTGYAGGYGNNVIKTTNGGLSWSIISSAYPYRRKLFFINANTGYSISPFPYVVYTTTGGVSWLAYTNIFCTDCYFRDVYFINTNTGILAGWTTTYRTTDAGSSWTSIFNERACISFKDSSNGIIGGPQRTINRTTNSGQSWTQIHSSGTYSDFILDINYIDNLNIAAAGSGGYITRTTNGGINWIQQTTPTTKHLTGLYFINQNTGWAVGDTGVILKTTTGGFTAVSPVEGQIPDKFFLYQNYPNPFNPTTHLRFAISELRFVNLNVYDILGREVAALVNEEFKPGTYEVEWDASNYPSGVYFYKLTTGYFAETKKMVLMK